MQPLGLFELQGYILIVGGISMVNELYSGQLVFSL